MGMTTERHEIVDQIHNKLLELLAKWQRAGYSPERIGDICGLSKVQIYGLLKKPGEPGYKGKNLTLNTVIKIWTGLGQPLESLFTETDLGEVPWLQKMKEICLLCDNLKRDEHSLMVINKLIDFLISFRSFALQQNVNIEYIIFSISDIIEKFQSIQKEK